MKRLTHLLGLYVLLVACGGGGGGNGGDNGNGGEGPAPVSGPTLNIVPIINIKTFS